MSNLKYKSAEKHYLAITKVENLTIDRQYLKKSLQISPIQYRIINWSYSEKEKVTLKCMSKVKKTNKKSKHLRKLLECQNKGDA